MTSCIIRIVLGGALYMMAFLSQCEGHRRFKMNNSRYSTDPVYREKCKAWVKAYRARNREACNARRRSWYQRCVAEGERPARPCRCGAGLSGECSACKARMLKGRPRRCPESA